MFVQVIRGKVSDPNAIQERLQVWKQELGPGAKGWLGATMGTTDDGTYINVVRFESEEAARANSDRPEQGEWWAETAKLFDGEPTFYNCPDVETMRGGGSDDAGFVQVMIYKPSDPARVRELNQEFEKFADLRPDLIGGTSALATDGTAIEVGYFTSEAEAREGEQMDFPEEGRASWEEWQRVAGEIEFLDLRDPLLLSP
jgi:hypothetical protein